MATAKTKVHFFVNLIILFDILRMKEGRQKEKKEAEGPTNLLVQKLMAEVMVDTGASITITVAV
jgi:hypothetical protein